MYSAVILYDTVAYHTLQHRMNTVQVRYACRHVVNGIPRIKDITRYCIYYMTVSYSYSIVFESIDAVMLYFETSQVEWVYQSLNWIGLSRAIDLAGAWLHLTWVGQEPILAVWSVLFLGVAVIVVIVIVVGIVTIIAVVCDVLFDAWCGWYWYWYRYYLVQILMILNMIQVPVRQHPLLPVSM